MDSVDCTCDDNDVYLCVEGRVIGPCEDPCCNGICTSNGLCSCWECHGVY